jgi:hypothetical protein
MEFFFIAGCVDFVHRPQFYVTRKYNVSEIASVSFKPGEGDIYSVGPMERLTEISSF